MEQPKQILPVFQGQLKQLLEQIEQINSLKLEQALSIFVSATQELTSDHNSMKKLMLHIVSLFLNKPMEFSIYAKQMPPVAFKKTCDVIVDTLNFNTLNF